MSLIIGLTGSIASGKTAVTTILKEKHIPVIDADKIARELVAVGQPTYEKIVQAFGEEILQADKSLDREKLGQLIFQEESKRQKLNDITHPDIYERMEKEKEQHLAAGHPIIVLDIPLLFERADRYHVDKTLVVYAKEEVQLARLMERNNLTKEEARVRIKVQISAKKLTQLADAVIDNSGSLVSTKQQLEAILDKWMTTR